MFAAAPICTYLIIGLTVVNVVRPGAGFNADPRTLDANAVAEKQIMSSADSFLILLIKSPIF